MDLQQLKYVQYKSKIFDSKLINYEVFLLKKKKNHT